MKKIFYNFCLALVCICSTEVFANNLTVSNVKIIEQNTSAGVNNTGNYTKIQFDLSWENSWRTNTGPTNWDAAWVFVKYRVGSGSWQHAKLNTSGHTAPSGSTINTTSDGMGAFIYKDAEGTGSNNFTGIKLRWNYGQNSLADTNRIDVQVFAIEMVYVPEGSFYLGTGGADSASFYKGSSRSTPFQVTSELAITIGTASDNLNYNSSNSLFGDGLGSLSADFPKGYNAFYCMKYEISQQQYVDFLNTLTYAQQNNRAAGSPTDAGGTGGLNTSNLFRSGIDVMTSGSSSGATTPAVYACNFDGDGIYNESNDGQNIACNYLMYSDLLAYLDWSGLRPMTELEFEKACRGNQSSLANEYANGTSSVTLLATVSDSGSATEFSTTTNANIVANNGASGFQGPMRTGIFATGSSARASSGGSYYGIMELSGNLWERTVSVGASDGRAFTGLHGNGNISATGLSDVSNWPGGLGLKGGAWNLGLASSRVSNRQNAANYYASRAQQYGGRGIRTAP